MVGDIHMHIIFTYSPLQKYWNIKANSFVFALHLKVGWSDTKSAV